MALNLRVPEEQDLKPRITVFGVGGAGGNAVNNMIDKELDGAEFVVANTDAQALSHTKAKIKIQMGVKVTEGLGAGARPSVGAAAAEETIEEIVDHLAGAHMCFITAGMGGGTGTGAAPIIAQAARELGVLTVGVVTKPFQFEGAKRMRQAEEGVEALQKVVDTLIIIPNQNLFRLANEKTTFTEAFQMADDVLYQGVKGITDLMVRPGLINLDFADVRSVMDEMGKAMMGTGEATGEERAIQAAEKAIANPLLDEISLKGAKGVLINITGGHDLTLFELDEAANRIREEVDPDANIIVGSTLDPSMEGTMRVSVVATGIDANQVRQEVPLPRRKLAEPLTPASRVAAPAASPAPEQPAHAAAAAKAPAQAVAQAPAREIAEPQQSLFDEVDDGEDPLIGDEALQSLFAEEEEEGVYIDDLPEPVFQPEQAAMPDTMVEAEPPRSAQSPLGGAPEAGFVAPQRPAPGTPSQEALARLRAAVNKVPGEAATAAPPQAAAQAPLRAAEATAQETPATRQTARERPPRFGINNLISRMTGHGQAGADDAAHPAPEPAPARAPVAEEPVHRNPEQERIEIPAFLRRQAN